MRHISFTSTVVPANSETLVLLDSTRGTGSRSAGLVSISTSSAYLAPGPFRYRWPNPDAVRLVVRNGDQAVTVKFEIKTGTADTSADWEEDSDAPDSGSSTVAASTTVPFEWKPSAPDWRLRILAGADNPSSLVCTVTAAWGVDYGT